MPCLFVSALTINSCGGRPLPPSYNTLAAGSIGGGGGNSQQHHYHNLPIIAGVGRSHSPGPAASASLSGTMFSYHNPTLAASPYSTLPRRLHQQSSVALSVWLIWDRLVTGMEMKLKFWDGLACPFVCLCGTN